MHIYMACQPSGPLMPSVHLHWRCERQERPRRCLHTTSQPCLGGARLIMAREPPSPGDNLTACRIGRIRSTTTTFCANRCHRVRLKERAVIHCPCPAVISRTRNTLTHPRIPLYHHNRYTRCCNHPPTHPFTNSPTPNPSPSVDTQSFDATHTQISPTLYFPPLHQPRVCLMTGASSNKPAV